MAEVSLRGLASSGHPLWQRGLCSHSPLDPFPGSEPSHAFPFGEFPSELHTQGTCTRTDAYSYTRLSLSPLPFILSYYYILQGPVLQM